MSRLSESSQSPESSESRLDYSSAGVDYHRIDALKVRAQQAARDTARHLEARGSREIDRSRGESAYVLEVGGVLLASVTECLGTKVLVADAVRPISGRTHYDTIAQDTIAMAVNDLITVGATPLSVQAYWAAGSSEWFSDGERMSDLVRGWQAACDDRRSEGDLDCPGRACRTARPNTAG